MTKNKRSVFYLNRTHMDVKKNNSHFTHTRKQSFKLLVLVRGEYMNQSQILQEVQHVINKGEKTIATIGMTSRRSNDFAILPRRSAFGFEAINFLVSNEQAAKECLKLLDNKVKYIFIDVEAKKNVDLMKIAQQMIKTSKLVPYKPNDATLEACDLFILNYFHHFLHDRHLLIYGVGNIGTKLALRLAERGAKVYLYSRNVQKVESISTALNSILPKYTGSKITPLQKISFSNYFDGIISFISAEEIIDEKMIPSLKNKAFVLDGGINNFSKGFYKKRTEKCLNCYRLDVRLGFAYTLLPLFDNVNVFLKEIQGREVIDGVVIVSGGVIGQDGDIVVDKVVNPTQIVGVANGLGGLKHASDYTKEDQKNILKVQQALSKF